MHKTITKTSVVFRAETPKFDGIIPAEFLVFFLPPKFDGNEIIPSLLNSEDYKNTDHEGLKGNIYRYYVKVPRNYRELPAKYPRGIFRKKIIPSGAGPGTGKPFIFPKNSRKEPENNANKNLRIGGELALLCRVR